MGTSVDQGSSMQPPPGGPSVVDLFTGVGGLALALLGIGFSALGVPMWLAWVTVIAGVGVLVGLLVFMVGRRLGVVRRRGRPDSTAADAEVPRPVSTFRYRDERLDLADDMDAFRAELEQMLEGSCRGASEAVEGGLGTLARREREEPEAYRLAAADASALGKERLLGYRMFWRAQGLQFYDAAYAHGVIGRQARAAVFNPDGLQLDNLPDLFARLARRLRYQAADKVIREASS